MGAEQTLQAVVELIEREPHGVAGLTLYALVNTLEHPKAGYLFKLDKLRDLDAGQRQLADALIDLMVASEVCSDAWTRAKVSMDECVRRS